MFVKKSAQPSVVNKGAERYALLLDVLARHYPQMVSLAEIVRETGLPKATAFRFMKSLQEVGFAAYDRINEAYYLGARTMDLGAKALAQNFAILAGPSLKRIAAQTGDTTFGILAENDHMHCLLRFTGDYPVRTLSLEEGDHWPLGVGAAGMAILAAYDDAYVDDHIERYRPLIEQYAPGATADMKPRVLRTRENGYALSRGELLHGMSAVGVAVFFPGIKRPIGAISIAAITDRIVGERQQMLVDLLHREATLISESVRAHASSN